MKWRRIRPGRKKLRRLMARNDANFTKADQYRGTAASITGFGIIHRTCIYVSSYMNWMDRRQWRRYERKRKRAGL